ncbi:Hypothetical predicted protein [Paramuricea clavata]|uniref:Uncharacterized protein n=1 Tax=Paramuricea clavata TaxID=317549 RepID=A0A6S7GDR6_PARCT|nr:Hypothetical predicted protein [Paramuricea clavata]
MEEPKRTVPTKQCQIEGCSEISVGSKVPLCRKHRNKTYKQNYKKKKKHAEGNFEELSQEIVIDDQYLLEQKYSNMLQDVLTQKQVELFQSPSVVRLLKRYQNKKLLARNSHASTDTYSSESNQSQQNAASEQKLHTEREAIVIHPSFSSKAENDLPETEVIQVMNSSADFPTCYNFTWGQDELSLPCDMIANLDTTLPYPNTTSSILQSPSVTLNGSTATTQKL